MTSPRPRPFWIDTVPSVAADDHVPDRTDVVVAGAGLVGVTTALLLARAGRRVILLDAAEVGARTTGASTAKVSLLQGTTLANLRSHAGDTVLRAYAEANRTAQEWVRREVDDVGELDERRAAFTYATTASGDEDVRAEAEASAVAGIDVDVLGRGDIGLPFRVTSALRLNDQTQVNPQRLLRDLVAKARAAGVRLTHHRRLTGVHQEEAGLRVETTRGSITSEHLVVATGFPVIDRAMMFATLTPTRQIVGAYWLPDGVPAPDGMFLSVDPVSRSLRVARNAQGREVLIAGGNAFAPGRDRDTRDRLDSLDEWMAEIYPGSTRTQWWAAQDYIKDDHRPFFGAMPRTGGRVLAATGFAKWGMTNAVAAALAIAGEITREPISWAAPFAHTGVAVRATGAVAASNLSVGREMITGWVAPAASHREDGVHAHVRRRGVAPVAESTIDGVPCRVSAVCPHLGGILRWNTAERSWDCPLHGSRFAPDGEVLEGPATQNLRPVD